MEIEIEFKKTSIMNNRKIFRSVEIDMSFTFNNGLRRRTLEGRYKAHDLSENELEKVMESAWRKHENHIMEVLLESEWGNEYVLSQTHRRLCEAAAEDTIVNINHIMY